MSFRDLSRDKPFNLADVDDSTIARRRRQASGQADHATMQQQDDTHMPELPTYNSMFLTTPDGDCGANSISLDELSFWLHIQAHESNIGVVDGREHQAPVEQHSEPTGPQEMAGFEDTTQATVAAPQSCDQTSSSTNTRGDTTVRLTIQGRTSGVFVASQETVKALRDLLDQPQNDHIYRTFRVRANIASEVLKGDLSEDDLISIRDQLERDTDMLANAI